MIVNDVTPLPIAPGVVEPLTLRLGINSLAFCTNSTISFALDTTIVLSLREGFGPHSYSKLYEPTTVLTTSPSTNISYDMLSIFGSVLIVNEVTALPIFSGVVEPLTLRFGTIAL